MIAELNNTFGERLPELLPGSTLRYEHDKRLHVSPFMGLDQRYRYAFSEPDETVYARIEVHQDGRMPLQAVLAGRRRELTNREVARFLVRYPLMPRRSRRSSTGTPRSSGSSACRSTTSRRSSPGRGRCAVTTVDRDLPRARQSRPSPVGRVAMSVLERVLPGIHGGTLVLRLPDGSERATGRGRRRSCGSTTATARPHRAKPQARARRVVPGGRVGLGRSRAAARAAPAQRRRGRRAPSLVASLRGGAAAAQPPHGTASRRAGTSTPTTTSATTSSRSSWTRR